MRAMRLQSAMEYLTTYGWAILIIAIALAALYALGVFNSASFTPDICSLPADFGCLSADLFASTSNVVVNIQQSTPTAINITAIGCSNDGTTSLMNQYSGANQIALQIGGNYTFNVPCYTDSATSTLFSGSVGQVYSGYLVINYTDLQSGFHHTISGRLVQKVV